MTRTQFYCLTCGVLIPGKLLPSPKKAVADPVPRYTLLFWLKEAVATIYPLPFKIVYTNIVLLF